MNRTLKALKEVVTALPDPDGIEKALLDNGYSPERLAEAKPEDEISIIWSIEDVHCLCEDEEYELTDAAARHILATAKKYHDAEHGIGWDTLKTYLWNEFWDIRRCGPVDPEDADSYLLTEADAAVIFNDLCKENDEGEPTCIERDALRRAVDAYVEKKLKETK